MAVQSVTKIAQIGVEVTPGTPVAANRLLPTVNIEMGGKADFRRHRPQGYRYATQNVLRKEWAEGSWEGGETFNEAMYLFAGLMKAAVITTPGGGATSRQHLFTDTTTSVPTNVIYTIEKGDSQRAQQYAYGLLTGMTIDFTRDELKFSGDLVARRMTDGHTMTATPTEIPLVPIMEGQLSVYLDSSAAALGNTKLLAVKGGKIDLTDRWAADWVVDAAEASFKTHVAKSEMKSEVQLDLEMDAAAAAFLTQARAGSTKFLRLEAVGSVIEAAITYLFRFDCAIQARGLEKFEDRDDVYIWPEPFEIVHDPTWGKALEVTIINTRTAL